MKDQILRHVSIKDLRKNVLGRVFESQLLLKIFAVVLFFTSTSFVNLNSGSPRLTKSHISYDYDACSAPLAVFGLKHAGEMLSFSFGFNDYLEKQDTSHLHLLMILL